MVKITKSAIYLDVIENNKIRTINVLEDPKYSILDAIDQYVDFEGVTVKDFMEYLNLYKEDINRTYIASLNGYDFEEYYRETKSSGVGLEELSYAEFRHECAIDGEGMLEYRPMFGAVGIFPNTEDLVTYMLDLCSMDMYMHLEIILNTSYSIKTKHLVDEEIVENSIFEAQKMFTLHEVITAFLYEISYHGTPEMRVQALERVVAEKYIESTKQPSSPEEYLSELEAELEDSLKLENYEQSAKIRDNILALRKQIERERQKEK